MKRYVLVELDTDDWGAVDAAAYVQSRDMRGFIGTISAIEVELVDDAADRYRKLAEAYIEASNPGIDMDEVRRTRSTLNRLADMAEGEDS
jgi:hypothetical protein